MTATVIAEISTAVGIIAAITLSAVLDAALLLRLTGDDRTQQQSAEDTGRHRAAVTTAATAMVTRAMVTRAMVPRTTAILHFGEGRDVRGSRRNPRR